MLTDKIGFYSSSSGFYHLEATRDFKRIRQKKISSTCCKTLLNFKFGDFGLIAGFTFQGNLVVVKYTITGMSKIISYQPLNVKAEKFSEIQFLKCDKKKLFNEKFRIINLKKTHDGDYLIVQDVCSIFYTKITQESFVKGKLREEVETLFKNSSASSYVVYKNSFDVVLPILNRNILLCCHNRGAKTFFIENVNKIGNLTNDPEGGSNVKQVNREALKEFTFEGINPTESISLLDTTKKKEFLVMSTVKDNSLCRLLAFKINYGDKFGEANPLSMLHQFLLIDNPASVNQFCYFSKISCETLVNGKYVILCYQRNYRYKKMVFVLSEERMSEVVGFSPHIGRWKSGIFVKKNNTLGSVLGGDVGALNSEKRLGVSVRDSGDRIWILGENRLDVLGFEEEIPEFE